MKAPLAGRKVPTAPRRASAGFTLAEVLIVVAIIGILTAIALPNYQAYLARGHRAEARGTLLTVAQYLERLRTERNSYRPGGNAPVVPAALLRSPAQGAVRYTLSVTTPDGNAFQVTATPVGAMADDVCGALSVDHTGLRAFTGVDGSRVLCWEK